VPDDTRQWSGREITIAPRRRAGHSVGDPVALRGDRQRTAGPGGRGLRITRRIRLLHRSGRRRDFFDFSDDELADVEEDMFNFEAEYGQDYDEQLVSHQTSYEYQQEGNVYETDEAWFEDWLDEE
jgi:hypothetical protein